MMSVHLGALRPQGVSVGRITVDDDSKEGGGGSLDTEIIPLGDRALRSILDHVVSVGDEAETSYLEVKSTLDLTSPKGVTKVAKFLLGTSNRLPQSASRHFHGYAVLVIGGQKGEARGIARGTEAHELEDRLRPYLGPQFPSFEFGRITVDADNEVLFVVSQPPQDGQPPFPCHRNYQGAKRTDNLDDGAIYVRGASNTRHARAGEVLALVERARGVGTTPMNLDISIVGPINRVERVTEVLEHLYEFEEEQFAKHKSAAKDVFRAGILAASILGGSQPTTVEDRAEQLTRWKHDRPRHIERGRAHFLGVALPGAGLRIVSRDRFVSKPHLIVTFHGCEALAYHDAENAEWTKVVEPIVRKQPSYQFGFDPANLHMARSREYPVSWSNRGDDAVVALTPESFRPNVPWTSDQDDYVLVTRDPQNTTVNVTWVLTEDSNDDATTGELTLDTSAPTDAAELFKAIFLPGD